jgi:two-component system chemotaxis response regulator CheY
MPAIRTQQRRAFVRDRAMKSIVIVDDSPTIRRMVRASLADIPAGTFIEAGSGLEAIEQLTLGPVGLMVLDLNMPDMHGVEVLKFVRRHPAYRTLPVIVLTTRGDEDSRTIAMDAGATLYLTKPFLPQVLARHASALFEGRSGRHEGASGQP